MPLHDLLSDERVAILTGTSDRGAILETLAGLLAGAAESSSPARDQRARAISDSLHARERLASTAIGHGVAIPHGRISGLEDSRGAFLRLDVPVDFGASDGVPVDLVLAMAVPEHHVHEHLQQLAELAESFADPGFRSRLRRADGVEALRECLLSGGRRRSAA